MITFVRTRRKFSSRIALAIPVSVLAFVLVNSPALASTLAVVDPEQKRISAKAAEGLRAALAEQGRRVLDLGLADAAFRSFRLESPFNLETETARRLGDAIGCRFYILVRADVQRRSRFGREEYYEAHAAYFLVNSVTGSLDDFQYSVFEEDTPARAEISLMSSLEMTALRLTAAAALAEDRRPESQTPATEEEDEDTRPPMPDSRVKPAYTSLAGLYGIEATVDAKATIAADGSVLEVSIVRWAGYGLDESVISAIRTMQWRPAERKGGFLPMSVLLRYNFRDLDDEKDN